MKKAEIIARYGEEEYQRRLEQKKQYRQEHKEEVLEQKKQYYQGNKEKVLERQKQYQQTPKGRSVNLCSTYQQADKGQNRGECTLTPDYIVDRIFPNGCLYCGDDDWTHLGADRINNDLPHTPENCICACGVCNIERQQKGMSVEEFKEYRSLHPRVLGDNPEKSWEIIELESGLKVIKKKQQSPEPNARGSQPND